MKEEKIKKFVFKDSKINVLLHDIWLSMEAARRSMSPYVGYIDPTAYSEYQNLVKNGYIVKSKNKQGKHFWKLSAKGFQYGELLNFVFGKKMQWDNKWRVLIFDIPESKKKYRNFLRRKLKELGFYMLQQSVWITPWPIPDSFGWFLNKFMLGRYVRYMVVEEINYDADLKRYFDIK